jgi:uncharacterized membrane protein YeaQ/YmgE (transglycosylase-associated protein family)
MNLIELLILIIIAGICGSIAQSMVGFSRRGCLISVLTGFIGALIGTWIARKLNLPDFFVINVGHRNFPVVWSIIGSVIFAAALSAISSRK